MSCIRGKFNLIIGQSFISILSYFQFIVGQDGTVGLTYEHSPSEGQPVAVMSDYVIDYM